MIKSIRVFSYFRTFVYGVLHGIQHDHIVSPGPDELKFHPSFHVRRVQSSTLYIAYAVKIFL